MVDQISDREARAGWGWARHVLLWSVSLTTFAIGIDTTVIGVALPTIHRELPVSAWGISSVVVGYTLTFGALMLAAGHIADVYGRRRVFLCGAALFAVSSLACGLAPTIPTLVVARLVQGCAAAVLNSAGLAILAQSFAGPRRQTAFRIWGAIMGASFALGPLVGGVATEYLGWRWVFLVNVPILMVCGVAVRRLVPGDGPRRDGSLDPFGQVLVVGLCAGLFLAVSAAGVIAIVGGISCAAVCSVVLLSRAPGPRRVIDRGYFANAAIIVVTAVPVAFSLCFWCLLIIVPERLGASGEVGPVRAAWSVLPLTAGLVFAAFIPIAQATHSFRRGFGIGFTGLAIGAALAAVVPSTPGVVTGMLIMGFAAGYMNPDVARSAITLAVPERAGMAAGLTSTMRQIGFGTGVLALGRLGTEGSDAARSLAPVFATAATIAAVAALTILSVRTLGGTPSC
ncbi:MFS transporter [Nocardia sp. NPDC050406]|uniref:MFS transporter n=1 Tax=Nocardia sp. NPDC050406 TaxID=3364318 RepID=UPI0037919C56